MCVKCMILYSVYCVYMCIFLHNYRTQTQQNTIRPNAHTCIPSQFIDYRIQTTRKWHQTSEKYISICDIREWKDKKYSLKYPFTKQNNNSATEISLICSL